MFLRFPSRLARWLVVGYQRWLSPLKPGPTCKYLPSCSSYAAEALSERGLIRGGLLAGFRILRCNPFSRGGYDPVPGVKR